MRGNRCEVYINDVKSKLFPLGSSGCRSNLPAALFGMTVSINEAGKEKENITKQRDSKKKTRFVWQCLGKVMTNGYMKYPNTSCPGVIGACWIPQADSIIHKIRTLPPCDSFEKYICMLNGYRNTRYEAKRQCLKSCKAENYKAVSRTNDAEPFPYVSRNTRN